ncbi:MAG TPA: carboxypeptidase regulatory-like domain-containing protein, partial [Holophagaceae bacterium]
MQASSCARLVRFWMAGAALALAVACGGGGGGAPAASASSPAATYTLSGVVSGSVIQGVTVSLGGAATASTATDASGAFSFTGLANGTYQVTPALSGYTFNPASSSVTVNGANVTSISFVCAPMASTYQISGTVTGAVLQGVTLKLTGAATASTT